MLVALGFDLLFNSCTYSKQQNIRSALYDAALLVALCYLNFASYLKQELSIKEKRGKYMKVKEL